MRRDRVESTVRAELRRREAERRERRLLVLHLQADRELEHVGRPRAASACCLTFTQSSGCPISVQIRPLALPATISTAASRIWFLRLCHAAYVCNRHFLRAMRSFVAQAAHAAPAPVLLPC